MPYEYRYTRRIAFHETDSAGIAHFSNYFKYMEEAEHAFLRELGFGVHGRRGEDIVSFPRVHAECDFKAPLRVDDLLEVHLTVVEKRAKVLGYRHVLRRLSGNEVVEVARGAITVVCVRFVEGESLTSMELPPLLAERIHVAPSDP